MKNEKKKKRKFSAKVSLTQVLAHIQLYDSYHNRIPFRQDFQRAHGREPYANPMIRFKWFVCSFPLSISLHLSVSPSLSPSRQQQHTYREQALTQRERKKGV